MNAAQFWNIENVKSFRGHDVKGCEIEMSDYDYVEHLNEIYGYVSVCGNEYGSGDILESQDPVAFRCGKSDHESYIQSELEEQLNNEDDSDIEFYDELEEEEEE